MNVYQVYDKERRMDQCENEYYLGGIYVAPTRSTAKYEWYKEVSKMDYTEITDPVTIKLLKKNVELERGPIEESLDNLVYIESLQIAWELPECDVRYLLGDATSSPSDKLKEMLSEPDLFSDL